MGGQTDRNILETRADQTGDRCWGRGQGSSVPVQGTRLDRRAKVRPTRAWKSGRFARLGAFATAWPFRSLNLASRKELHQRRRTLYDAEYSARLLPSFKHTSVNRTSVRMNSSWEESHGRWKSIWWLGWGMRNSSEWDFFVWELAWKWRAYDEIWFKLSFKFLDFDVCFRRPDVRIDRSVSSEILLKVEVKLWSNAVRRNNKFYKRGTRNLELEKARSVYKR